ncbi:phytoene/squalene synthase family protein [Paeniglutamicibacter sp. Y32M11]|uniref:phytoene/squalene synthase family protein n=1 Tax=Paeniglutamicibacter sp. Y32M11 TaxID=2853258 RepID=UPI002102E4DB|nr:phytoene/squalene synthase family protein [Paeniglutamicibacter sp. Y32M11]
MMNGPTLARTEGPTALQRYSATASSSARVVITRYSTSFSLACRMLGSPAREHISNVYALVRLADEVVDGVAREAGLKAQEVAAALEQLEAETEAALASGYSTNMIVHAFACTARSQGITTELTRPFFASMRSDLLVTRHDDATLQGYIYGSAEVVGLMCLAVFRCMPDAPAGHEAQTETAARRLGAAFQKVNFLRDLATDTSELGRSYFPGLDPTAFSDEHKNALVREIGADLDAAALGIAHLAPRAARAVAMAHGLFSELNHRLERTPAAELMTRRISVPNGHKAMIALRTALGRRPSITTSNPATKGQP